MQLEKYPTVTLSDNPNYAMMQGSRPRCTRLAKDPCALFMQNLRPQGSYRNSLTQKLFFVLLSLLHSPRLTEKALLRRTSVETLVDRTSA